MPFREAWVIVGVAFAIIGFAVGESVITGLGILVLIVGAGARYWHSHLFDNVTLTASTNQRRAFQGEQVDLTIELDNQKLLPLPWFEWRVTLPESVDIEGETLTPASSPGRNWLSKRGASSWYEKRSWQVKASAHERGYHHIGPSEVSSGDILGLFPDRFETDEREYLIAYPRIYTLEELGLPADRPLGDRKGRNQVFEDPLRISGLRDYQPGDPLKRIDWKATARRGELQSRVYEPSAVEHLYLFMNIDTLEHSWEGYLKADLERTISVAASIAAWAADQRLAIGLVANGSYPYADRPIRLSPSSSRDQVTRVLEALAVIQPLTMSSLAGSIHREMGRMPSGSTVVVVASYMSAELAAAINRIHASGHVVTLIATSDRIDTTPLADFPIHAFTKDFDGDFARPGAAQ